MKNLLYQIFKYLGFRVISRTRDIEIQDEINFLKKENEKLKFLLNNNISRKKELLEFYEFSKSQICQDWFVLESLNYKKNGYFVDIGAASGVELSNSYLLEKKYNWKGILSEPSPHWRESLDRNRSCKKDFRCVYSVSDQLISFHQTEEKEYSTISKFSDFDKHRHKRKKFTTFQLQTITLEDLLEFHDAPNEIDYLSLDTEGSEFEILKDFNFNFYTFKVITVEHNNTDNQLLIDELLSKNGYQKQLEAFSQFESWYTKI